MCSPENPEILGFTISELYGFLRLCTELFHNHSPYIVFMVTVSYMVLCWIPVNCGWGMGFLGSEPFPEEQEGSQDTADYHRHYQH